MNPLLLVLWLLAASWVLHYTRSTYVIYSSRPSVSKYEQSFQPPDPTKPQSVKFPTISVCSLNKVKRSFLQNNNKLEQMWRGFNPYEHSTSNPYEHSTSKVLHGQRKKHNEEWSYELENITFEDIIESGGPVDTHLLSCTQRNKRCVQLMGEEWMVMENTMRGRCWRVNPEGTLYGKGGKLHKFTCLMKECGPLMTLRGQVTLILERGQVVIP